MRVRFPNGVEIDALPLRERRDENPDRDFGLYMDPRWAPTWEADLIDWEDFGLPTDPAVAVAQISAAYRRAESGERVEIGCIGGLGRTGTVVACMAVLAGVPADEAVTWVREHYDPGAVETPEQEAWVIAFASAENRSRRGPSSGRR